MKLSRISSIVTLPYKFGFPLLAIIFLIPLIWERWSVSPAVNFLLILEYLISLLLLGTSLWMFGPVKRVSLDEKDRLLYVSNYRKEIAIPLSEIADVSSFILSEPSRITISLRSRSEFGQKIVFLATYRISGWLSGSHPIVEELLVLAARSSESPL